MEAELKALLASKQDSAYQQIKPTIAAVGRNDKEAIKTAVTVIRAVLGTPEHKVWAKLNALRFLRDCYLTGSKPFIRAVEKYVLSHMKTIAENSVKPDVFELYADREYSEKEDLVKFKGYLFSMFTLCIEAIKNWADWNQAVEPELPNPFLQLRKELEKAGVRFPLVDQYFKEGNKPKFVQNYKTVNKAGSSKLEDSQQKPPSAVKEQQKEERVEKQQKSKPQSFLQAPPNSQVQSSSDEGPTFQPKASSVKESKYHRRIVELIGQVRELSEHPSTSNMKESVDQFGSQLEEAFDQYATNETKNFNEEFVSSMYDQYDDLRDKIIRRIAEAERQKQPPLPQPVVKHQPAQVLPPEEQPPKEDPRLFGTAPTSYNKAPAGSPQKQQKQVSEKRAVTQINEEKREHAGDFPESEPRYGNKDNRQASENNPSQEAQSSTHQRPLSTKPRFHEQAEAPTPQPAANTPNNRIDRMTFGQQQSSLIKSVDKSGSKVDPQLQQYLNEDIERLTQERNRKALIVSQIHQKLESSDVSKLKSELSGQAAQLQRMSEEVERLEMQLNRQEKRLAESIIEPTTNHAVEQLVRPQPSKQKEEAQPIYEPMIALPQLTLELSDRELSLFKMSLINKGSQLAPGKPYNIQLVNWQLLTRGNKQQYCHLELSSDAGQHTLQIENSPNYTVWKKPSTYSPTDSRTFHEVVITLQDVPLPYVRCMMTGSNEPGRRFYLPVLFINFLKPGNVEPRDFQKVFSTHEDKVVHSKILKLNGQLAGDFEQLRVLLNMERIRIRGQESLCSTYLYEAVDVLLLAVIELLINQRVVVRVLQLNQTGGNAYAKELLRNLTFLLSK